ncbi:hypothetical protein SAMN06309944_0697 [Micrococcales bacterium KH10]|nr:hypothetical protein SAMN06309944_0697 [Micrococcales bacterium KH10]
MSPMIPGPGGIEIDQDEFMSAVDAQKPMVRTRLARMGWSSKTEEVMATVISDAWESLGRWSSKPERPPLVAWVCGVARNTLHEWNRRERPGRIPGGTAQSLDDLPIDPPATTDQPDAQVLNVDPQAAADLIGLVRAKVIAQPGGVARWARLSRDALHETRGISARAELRALLFSTDRSTG